MRCCPALPAAVAALLVGCLLASLPAAALEARPVAVAACTVARPPNSLWSLARCCAEDLQSNPGCRDYSKSRGFIILKDNSPAKPVAYLIIPTAKVTGIEDPHIFARPVVDFWDYGWQEAQIYVKRPAAEMGLAINSEYGRTQNQLHIHISCVRPDVARALAENAWKIGSDPANPTALLLGPRDHAYRVVKAANLIEKSPFDVVAAMPGARADMADQSIAVIGSAEPGVYYVLDTSHHGGKPGAAEELLDQSCRA